MQKIDFVKNLETIVEKLKSTEIVSQFNTGFEVPGANFDYARITPLLFTSKSNYDQLKENVRYKEILNLLNAQGIYQETNLSLLTNVLRNSQAQHILTTPSTVALFNFHNTIVNTYNLSKEVLQGSELTENLQNEINNGVVVFQILIEGEGLETEQYIKIFTSLNELINTISKVLKEDNEKSEIVLLDSGSDSNIGVKSGVETAKSLFLIFKEIWDLAINHKFYAQKQKNQSLLESLSIRAEIVQRVKDGVLTPEEGKEYTHLIKTRTDDLIGMKVLPKQIVIDSNQVENKKLLSELEGTKMLSSGDTTSE